MIYITEDGQYGTIHITEIERQDMELAIRLRAEGIITTPEAPYEHSQKIEIQGLVDKGVFSIGPHIPEIMEGMPIFPSRMVNEIKDKGTKHLKEK